MKNAAAYEIAGLSYSYLGRFPALKDIDIRIEASEKIALIGANGSGKSTLLLVLAALIFPQKGSMKFFGNDLKEESFGDAGFQKDFRKKVGIVFQNSDTQLFNSSVEDELNFGLAQLGLPKEEAGRRLAGYIDMMGIGHLIRRHPQNLSMGEKKRVAIASVLAMEPEVMLLDEPTAGLDPRTARHLIDAISAFGEEGRTIITTTQDIHIVCEIADRIIVMGEDKTVVKDGLAEEVLADRALLEEHNLIHAHSHVHKGKTHVHPHEHPAHDHPHDGAGHVS